jgi:hypothetical protein
MKNIYLLFLFLISFLLSCSKDDTKIDSSNLLIGIWSYSDYKTNSVIYTRSSEFADNHCYKFNSNGTLIERKNAGWCGTPPISYADFDGTWSIQNDTILTIKVGYWGGETTYSLDVESVNENTLEVITLLEIK